ncbi:hypothetical protein [Saccharicrinis sp. FJH62]|uniref:hypothetical protein n=1 Tax=Saccharicrinis sp. FJH62 TaxID=3344657 RepID=UPI0035D42933
MLIGLGMTVGCLIAGGSCYEIPAWRLYSGIAFGGIFALSIGFVGILGLIRRIPDWSVIWIAISVIGFMVLINYVSTLGFASFPEILVLLISVATGLTIFYMISIKSWQIAGLFGIGLSTALSLILLFMITNISHNEIKIGYYDLIVACVASGFIYLYLKGNNQIKIITLFVFMFFNSLLIFIFDKSMLKLNHDSQLLYLIIFSNGLLFSGIIFHHAIGFINRLIRKK